MRHLGRRPAIVFGLAMGFICSCASLTSPASHPERTVSLTVLSTSCDSQAVRIELEIGLACPYECERVVVSAPSTDNLLIRSPNSDYVLNASFHEARWYNLREIELVPNESNRLLVVFGRETDPDVVAAGSQNCDFEWSFSVLDVESGVKMGVIEGSARYYERGATSRESGLVR